MSTDSDLKNPTKLPTNNLTSVKQVSMQITRNTKSQDNIIVSKMTNSTVIALSESKLEEILDKEFERMNISMFRETK